MGVKWDIELKEGDAHMIGHIGEAKMYDKVCRAGNMLRAWHNGLVILHEGEFMNVYEREADRSWSMTRTKRTDG